MSCACQAYFELPSLDCVEASDLSPGTQLNVFGKVKTHRGSTKVIGQEWPKLGEVFLTRKKWPKSKLSTKLALSEILLFFSKKNILY